MADRQSWVRSAERPLGDSGGAMVELLALTLVLLVPLIYLVVTLGLIQAAAYAAEGAANDAARTSVLAGVEVLEEGGTYTAARAAADARAQAVVPVAIGDFGISPDQADLQMACSADPCLAPGSDVTARVGIRVPLPGVPGFVADAGLAVTVSAESTMPVDSLGEP